MSAAVYGMGRFGLVVTSIHWEPGPREFVIDLMAPPGVVRACEQGSLVPHASIVLYDGDTEIVLGEALLWDYYPHTMEYSELRSLDSIRVPWEQGGLGDHRLVEVAWVMAALKDRTGGGIGRMDSASFGAWIQVGGGSGSATTEAKSGNSMEFRNSGEGDSKKHD
ncbi:MAG: hypothetical protein O7H41_15775 [Planctomycetota bacterium]|nr:hypothetical protein [Planctomycetota bacterium]